MLISALLAAAVVAVVYRTLARGGNGFVLLVAVILASLGALLLGLAAHGALDTSSPDSYLHPWGVVGAVVGAVLAVTLAHFFGRQRSGRR